MQCLLVVARTVKSLTRLSPPPAAAPPATAQQALFGVDSFLDHAVIWDGELHMVLAECCRLLVHNLAPIALDSHSPCALCCGATCLFARAVRVGVGNSLQTQAYFQNVKLSAGDLSLSYVFTK